MKQEILASKLWDVGRVFVRTFLNSMYIALVMCFAFGYAVFTYSTCDTVFEWGILAVVSSGFIVCYLLLHDILDEVRKNGTRVA